MHEGSPFVPRQLKDERAGMRPSAAALVGLVDTEEEAFPHVAAILRQMGDAGVELDAVAVRIAIKMGRHTHMMESRKRHSQPERQGIVYYVRRGELIKIGTTRNPIKRFNALMPDEILAFEPGGSALEAQRHGQFGDSRLTPRSEYFRPSESLKAHIEAVRAKYGPPNPDWPSVRTIRRGYRRTRQPVVLPEPGTEHVTATEGAKVLRMNRATVQGWVHRKLISPVGQDAKGRPVYCLGQLRFLIERNRVWQNHRKVTG